LNRNPRDESAISPRDLVLIDIYHAVGVGLGLVDTIRGADFQSRGLLLALRTGEKRRIVRGIGLDAGIVGSQGPRSNARALANLGRATEILGDAEDPYLRAWVLGATGLVRYFRGDFREASELMVRAEVMLREETIGNIWELNTVSIFRLLALRYLGRWGDLRRGFDETLRDATRRGDRYAETTLTRALNVAWLVGDDPARAKRELAACRWSPLEGGYHMQHWYELRARMDLALYEGEREAAWDLWSAAEGALKKSFLQRAQTIRTESLWMVGRAAVARGKDSDVAEKAARALDKEGVGYGKVWAAMLRAGVSRRKELLEDVVKVAERHELAMCAAAARMLLGDVHGEEAMAANGVKQPARVVSMLLPGFGG
jgi:hypothetical protein